MVVAGPAGTAGASTASSTDRASIVDPATAAGMVNTAPSGTMKHSCVATPNPSTCARRPRSNRRRSEAGMPRASNGRELNSRASSRPESTTPSTGARTAPTTGMNPDRPTPIAVMKPTAMSTSESRTDRQNPRPRSGTSPPISSSTARQMRS